MQLEFMNTLPDREIDRIPTGEVSPRKRSTQI
jgi:hypothetical protein